MEKIHIDIKNGYDVIIGEGVLESAAAILKDAGVTGKLCIVSDSNVAPLYLERLTSILKSGGYEVYSYVFPAGEESKNISTLSSILEFFAECGMTRKDSAVALGGGVTGDMTGFASGVYMRGISYVQIPTTLLACVDSSVGGKTAVDLEAGKNLAGVFIQPKVVIADTGVLTTLDKSVYADGMAEVIKTAILGDRELFNSLFEGCSDEYIISRCVAYKGKIVSEDEFETGVRKLLNLGHTPAHSIEKLSKYTIPHGHAVAMGLGIMARASFDEGYLSIESCQRILALLKKYNLPDNTDFSFEDMAREAMFDKKRQKNSISFIKIKDIEDCIIEEVANEKIKDIFQKGMKAI